MIKRLFNHSQDSWKTNSVVILSALFIFCFLSQLLYSHFGRFMPAIHGDWANHASAIKFLTDGINLADVRYILNEYTIYPRATYLTAAFIAKSFNIPAIYALTMTIQLALFISCLFYALRAGYLAQNTGRIALIAFFICLFFSSYKLLMTPRDLVVYNSFVTQLSSLALAQVFLYLALRFQHYLAFLFITLISAFTLAHTHLVGFVWAGTALCIMAAFFPGASIRTNSLLMLSVIIINVAAFCSCPGLLEMVKIAGTGGDLRVFKEINASDFSSFFITMMALYIITMLSLSWYAFKRSSFSTVVFRNAGFIVLGPLILASAATVLMRGGNWYPTVKWLYTFTPEFSLVLLNNNFIGRPTNKLKFLVVVIIAFFLQLPFVRKNIDLQIGALADQGISKNVFDQHTRLFPGLKVQHPALNYYIAKAIIRNPRDEITSSWIFGAKEGPWKLLGPENFVAVPLQLHPNELVLLDRKHNADARRMLREDWNNIHTNLVFPTQSPSVITFDSTTNVSEINFGAVAVLNEGQKSRHYRLLVNGKEVGGFDLQTTDPKHPQRIAIKFPTITRGRMLVAILWDKQDDADSGIGLTSFGYR